MQLHRGIRVLTVLRTVENSGLWYMPNYGISGVYGVQIL